MTAKRSTQTEKAEKPQGTLPQDPHADNPGEQADVGDEAVKLAQQRVDDGQEGTIKADQEAAE